MKRPPLWTYPALLLGVTGISFASVFIRSLERSGMPLLAVAGYRMALAALFLFPAFVSQARRQRTRWPAGLLVFSGVCLAVHFGAWTLSFHYLSIARSVVIVDCQPVFVAVAAALILRERMGWRAMVGVTIALAGLLILFFDRLGESAGDWRGDLLALLGAVAVAGYLLAGRRLRSEMGVFAYVVPVYAVSAVLLLAGAAGSGASLSVSEGRQWMALVALAVVPTLCGHTVMNWLLKYVPTTIVSLSFLLEPFGAASLAFWIFAEVPTAHTVSGGLVILAGIVLTVLDRPLNTESATPELSD